MTNYEILVEQDKSWPTEMNKSAYDKSLYKAMDDLTTATKRLFEPVITEIENLFDKAARYLDD